MQTIPRVKNIKIGNIRLTFQVDIQSMIDLEHTYGKEAVSIYKSILNVNSTTTTLFINVCKLLSCSVKNTYITNKELEKLFISAYKKPINVIKNIYPIVIWLLDGFLQEDTEEDIEEDIEDDNNITQDNIECYEDKYLTELLSLDILHARAIQIGLNREDFLSNTPKGILKLIKIMHPKETREKRAVDRQTGEEIVIQEVDPDSAMAELRGW